MWIVCQHGAREHYAVSRALHRRGMLECLVTDVWVPPGSWLARLPLGRSREVRRMRGRFHAELGNVPVLARNLATIRTEIELRLRFRNFWDGFMFRYASFEAQALKSLRRLGDADGRVMFASSNAALSLFEHARRRGWRTVLGQVDPGPEEERIVIGEHQRYPGLEGGWQPAPAPYWDRWREEVALADRIIINSEWSRQCMLKEGIPAEKLRIIPLTYEPDAVAAPVARGRPAGRPLKVLFLGLVCLRKGAGRLLEAMRLLKDEPIELTMVGDTWIDPSAWADLPKVRYIPKVPRAEVDALYDAADVFILPTLSDGYALTQLEALARGLPVLASAHCGAAVRDGHNGWILADLEPATIAKKLATLDPRALAGPVAVGSSFGMPELGAALSACLQ